MMRVASSQYIEEITHVNSYAPMTEKIMIPHSAFSDALGRVNQCFSFSINKPEAEGLAIVGESGTGQTSVLRTFLERHKPTHRADGLQIPILFASVPSWPTRRTRPGVILQ